MQSYSHVHIHIALLRCSLFPSFHSHVVCVFITTWYLISFVTWDFPVFLLFLSCLAFLFLHTGLGHVLHLFLASVNFALRPMLSHSFVLRNDLSFSVFWTQTVWPCINLLLVTSVSPCLFLSPSCLVHQPFFISPTAVHPFDDFSPLKSYPMPNPLLPPIPPFFFFTLCSIISPLVLLFIILTPTKTWCHLLLQSDHHHCHRPAPKYSPTLPPNFQHPLVDNKLL